ncbi:hypothetical protein K440DRAFT_644130 [Wilcoxina mikolae CBS 423.85]|nr:hypothetical protein K440DRAFT_644130 [Wilcoxina mikolae CBS 423.85]
MPTGFEVAGLALAIFPILVQGLGFYVDGAQKIKDLRDHKHILNRLVVDLTVERVCFEEQVCALLEGVVSAETLAELMSGVGWEKPEFQHQLSKSLGEETAMTFKKLVGALFLSLKELNDNLGLEEGKENALDDISKTVRQLERLAAPRHATGLKQTREIRSAKMYSSMRNHAINLHGALWEKFRSQSACQCPAVHNANLRLENVSATISKKDQSNPRFSVLFSFDLSPIPNESPSMPWIWREIEFEALNDNPRIQSTATADSGGFPKVCDAQSDSSSLETTHEVPDLKERGSHRRRLKNVVLKPFKRIFHSEPSPPRRSGGPSVSTRQEQSTPKKSVMFASDFDTPKRTLTFELELAQEIKDLCATIANTSQQKTALGVLGSGKGWWFRTSIASHCGDYRPEAVSLDSLLEREALRMSDRLRLGVQLASALMQLHRTEWLGESWGKQDIFFPQMTTRAPLASGGFGLILNPVVEKPFVRRSFGTTGDIQNPEHIRTMKSSLAAPYDKSLFSLGIVLIELWFGKRFQDLLEYPKCTKDLTDTTDFLVAYSLLSQVQENAGAMYGIAVRRCIVGLEYPSSSTTLDDDNFKSAVHINVVSELERNWTAYVTKPT